MDDVSKRTITLNSGTNIEFVFQKNCNYVFNFEDFIRSTLTGVLNEGTTIRMNFHFSSLENLHLSKLDFNSCDFLDSSISKTSFSECDMKGTHFNSSNVYKSYFTNCNLELTNYNKTRFTNCVFENCRFENILIKNCEFDNCQFNGGSTSNKLFENCIITNCQFKDIEMQTQTIIENFGISINNISNVCFRCSRRREVHKRYKSSEVINVIKTQNSFERLSLLYFNNGVSIDFYKHLFAITEDKNWVLDFRTSSTFISKIENFVSFIEYLYNHDEVILLSLIKIKDFTNIVIESLEKNNNAHYDIIRNFEGLRMMLSRYTNEFLLKIDELESDIIDNNIVLEAKGYNDELSYKKLLYHLTSKGIIKIDKIVFRNSPVDIFLSLINSWAFIATFLSTRLKYQFSSQKIETLGIQKKTKIDTIPKRSKKITSLKKLDIQIGPLGTKDKDIGIKVFSVFSNNISHSLYIGFSAKRAIELHKNLIRLKKIF